MSRALFACAVCLVVAGSAFAQGGMEVRVVSAKVVPNPHPEMSSDKPQQVLLVEAVGTDRSGASQIQPRFEDTVLYDSKGLPAARLLYLYDEKVDWSAADGTAVMSAKLAFRVPEGPPQPYSLKWAVARYQKQVTTFRWVGGGRPLQLPLSEERAGLTVTIESVRLGHYSEAEIRESSGDAEAKAKMAADHLILDLTFSALCGDPGKAPCLGGDYVCLTAAAADDPTRTEKWSLPGSSTRFEWPEAPDGALRPVRGRTSCHFVDRKRVPQITELLVEFDRLVPFDQGWASLGFSR